VDGAPVSGEAIRLPQQQPGIAAAAARAAFGVALVPDFIAVGDPGLKRVFPEETLPEPDLWLLMRRDLAKIPRIRAVADYLIELFRREGNLFSA
jgi:DNA-binding transcriptional LysR family regulator